MWRPVLAHFGERFDATALTPAALFDYAAARRAKAKGQTIRRELGCLRRSIREARIRGIMQRDPIDWDLLPRIRNDAADQRKRGKLWADIEIARILEHLSPRAVTAGIRDRCVLIMLTGLRKEELDRLRPEWITLTPGEAWPAVLALPAEGAKWGRPRAIPLCAAALEIISAHAREGQPTVFARAGKPNKALALASERAGFTRTLTPRDLRTWYLNAAERAAGAVLAQRLGGHSSIATTGLYLRADERRAMAAGIAVSEHAIAAICITPTDHSRPSGEKTP
jgi:integrase